MKTPTISRETACAIADAYTDIEEAKRALAELRPAETPYKSDRCQLRFTSLQKANDTYISLTCNSVVTVLEAYIALRERQLEEATGRACDELLKSVGMGE